MLSVSFRQRRRLVGAFVFGIAISNFLFSFQGREGDVCPLKDSVASVQSSGAYERQKRYDEQTRLDVRRAALGRAHSANLYTGLSLIDAHPALIPLDPEYAPRPELKASFPDIYIVGDIIAGTERLFQLLLSHPDSTSYHPDEMEHCMGFNGTIPANVPNATHATREQRDVQRQLFEWHEKLAMLATSRGNDLLTVDRCHRLPDLWLHLHYLKPDSKFIVLFRDPADWMWAGWNYWIDEKIDHDPPQESSRPRRLASLPNQYRSPELFHEIIASGGRVISGLRQIEVGETVTRTALRLISLVGRENVLFLRSEDMVHDVLGRKEGVLDQLSAFVGLDPSRFEPRKCNSNRGHVRSDTACVFQSDGAYELSGYQMMPSTRYLIYLQLLEECRIWANQFDIVYPGCLNVSRIQI